MLKKWKKLSEEVVHQNPWWIYKHDTFEKTDGSVGDYYYGACNGNSIVIPILPDGKTVLVRNYRYVCNEESIEFPCGGVEKGSTPEETAKRELLEETGYIVDTLTFVGRFQGLNGVFENQTRVFVAFISDIAPQAQHLESTEQLEVSSHTFEEVQTLIDEGKIWDGNTLSAWALARRFLP